MDAVVVRAGALGDILLLRRAIAWLRAAGYSVRLLAPPAADVLVAAGRGEVHERLPWESRETAQLLAGETDGRLTHAVRAADLVVAYTRSETVVRALRPLARRLIAADPTPPAAGPHASVWSVRPRAAIDAASGNAGSAGPEGAGRARVGALDEPCAVPDLRFSQREQAEAARLLAGLPAGFLAVHHGSGSPSKNWPLGQFLAFAGCHARGAPWLWVLGPAEAEPAASDVGPAVLARNLPLRVLGATLARAGLYVGNDSGISHLAAAAGAPTLALFGPTDPALWAPQGRRVRCLRAPGGCDLAATALEDVLRAADALRLT